MSQNNPFPFENADFDVFPLEDKRHVFQIITDGKSTNVYEECYRELI